jgi:hypothetical protein
MISDNDVEDAILWMASVSEPGGEMVRTIYRARLAEGMILAVEADLATGVIKGDPKLAADKVKWEARATEKYLKAIKEDADAQANLEALRNRFKAETLKIEIWRTQSANDRKGHL